MSIDLSLESAKKADFTFVVTMASSKYSPVLSVTLFPAQPATDRTNTRANKTRVINFNLRIIFTLFYEKQIPEKCLIMQTAPILTLPHSNYIRQAKSLTMTIITQCLIFTDTQRLIRLIEHTRLLEFGRALAVGL
jgi:hypothetical protein